MCSFPRALQGPCRQKNMLSVLFDIYCKGSELYIFFPRFLILSLSLFRRATILGVCVHTVNVSGHAGCCILYPVFPPHGHASGTTTYYICHWLYSVTSIFCQQVFLCRFDRQIPLPLHLLAPSFLFLLTSLYICQIFPFVNHPFTLYRFTLAAVKKVLRVI